MLGSGSWFPHDHCLVRNIDRFRMVPLGIKHATMNSYDVMHIFATALPQQALLTLLLKLLGRSSKLVVDWDDMWGFDFVTDDVVSNLLSLSMKTFQRNTSRISDGVCVVSDALRGFAERSGVERDKIFVVPNSCDIDNIIPREMMAARMVLKLGEYPIVLVVGYPYANGAYANSFRLLFDGFSTVRKVLPDARLIMIGKRVIPPSVVASYEAIKSAMIEVGSIPYSSITPYLMSADVLYFPMDPNVINDYYRWPIRFCDYLASGKPIVSNAIGTVRALIAEEGCALVTGSDREEIASGLLSVLQDRSRAEHLARRARKTAEKYSIPRVASLIEDCYARLVRKAN